MLKLCVDVKKQKTKTNHGLHKMEGGGGLIMPGQSWVNPLVYNQK
jgi:hypothetical protein